MSTFEFRTWALCAFIIVVILATAVTCGGGHNG